MGSGLGPVLNSVTGLSNSNMGGTLVGQPGILSPQASYNFSGGLAGPAFNDQSNGLLSVINNPSGQTKASSSTAE